MSETNHRLVLWFMRDLREWDRQHLFSLYGLSHFETRDAQQKAFIKIIADASMPGVAPSIQVVFNRLGLDRFGAVRPRS